MKINLKNGDKVFCPCSNWKTGSVWLEEMEVVHIDENTDENSIKLKLVAAHRIRDNKFVRILIREEKQISGDKRMRDYFSRPSEEIMKEFNEQGRWIEEQIINGSIGELSGEK